MLLAIKALVVFLLIYLAVRVGIIAMMFFLGFLLLLYYVAVCPTFLCPDCKEEFRQEWYRNFTSWHFGGSRYTTCPHCGRRGWFRIKPK